MVYFHTLFPVTFTGLFTLHIRAASAVFYCLGDERMPVYSTHRYTLHTIQHRLLDELKGLSILN
jgi:hypothetical protein